MKIARNLLRKMSTAAANAVVNGKTVPLTYKVIAKCSKTKARVGVMSLLHSDVDTPVFMPVGTQVNAVEDIRL